MSNLIYWTNVGRCRGSSWQAIDFLGVPTGIRTPVTAVKGRCPRPLDDRDYEAIHCYCNSLSGGGKRDRTADLLHAMQALSQLSYTPTQGRELYTLKACAVSYLHGPTRFALMAVRI